MEKSFQFESMELKKKKKSRKLFHFAMFDSAMKTNFDQSSIQV